MFNRTSKLTALLVAAAAVTSIVPATAAERLGTKEGTITKAIAFDGAYVYDGYRTDDDDAGLYFNNGKDKMVDEDEDYSYDELAKYGSKYALIQDDEDFLVDLSNGKILDDESVEDKETNTRTKLNTSLKKTDRYGKTDSSDITLERLNKGSFADVWYKYTATTGAGAEYNEGKLYGFTNESAKYVDATHTANMYVYSSVKGATVKVEEFNDEVDYTVSGAKHKVEVQLENLTAIAQDSDYIYAVAEVAVINDGVKDENNQYFVQKISKSQGDKKDGAYLPKSVTSYQLGAGSFSADSDSDDLNTVYDLLVGANKADVVTNGVQVKNGNLVITTIEDDKKVVVYTVKLKKTKLDAINNVDNVDTYIAISDSDEDQDIITNGKTRELAVSIDAEGNTWALDKGAIYKFDGSKFKEMYTCDRSLTALDVYNDSNLIAWEEDGDVYTTVNEGKAVTDEEAGKEDDKTEEVVKSGWDKNADGTWSYYNNGAKATGWVQAGAWYYLNANGIMQTGWVNDNGTWYYCNASGAMQTGWLLDGSTWYYLQANGAMKTGWLNDNGTWYYLNANGSMAANTTVDGYKLGANGAWIR
ncbi:N-acetylmuramoyl-L-alanine amidase family protein [Clostridium butyricum]|uniref:PspC family transcriptional regulator n=1 Tax=Clostridium butyricum TaxID=1492 RepID=A0A2S7F848_CLOBU|nr:N-acetylmuramoyl-L-alanine amidase family protein [Clostridium butyricum]KHD13824.1 PspC family transcriptional regulator [Clostridium butyricum]PPV13422.1 PspC family transcriptional regulator [Clostridium butyricum]